MGEELASVRHARALGLEVELHDVGPSSSMEEHEGKLGVPAGSLCKTLVVRRGEDDHVFVIVSGGRRMTWPKVRAALGVKRASMAARDEVAAVTGYVPGTVTVLGATTHLPVYIDAVAAAHDRITIGSGRSGASLVTDTGAFITLMAATVADLTERA